MEGGIDDGGYKDGAVLKVEFPIVETLLAKER